MFRFTIILAILQLVPSVHAQVVRIKFPVTLIDSMFNTNDNTLIKVRGGILTFGIHPKATRCNDWFTPFDSFTTHWTINDTGSIDEITGWPEWNNDGRYVWDLSGCSDGIIWPNNIMPFNALNDRDTFRIDMSFKSDTSLYHHAQIYWPSVLGEYFDTCALIQNFGRSTQSTQADMRMVSSFTIPQNLTINGLFARYTFYIHGLKIPPGPPATLTTTSPADGDTGIVLNPLVSWLAPTNGAYYYGLQVSTDSNFDTFVFNDTLSANSKQLAGLQAATKYYWRVYVQNQYGASYYQDPPFHFTTTVVSDVDSEHPALPLTFRLDQNYPNPFNPSTTIRYSLPEKANVSVKVFNLLGQEVETLIDGVQNRGYHETVWQPSSRPSGVYYYRIRTGNFNDIKKMLYIK